MICKLLCAMCYDVVWCAMMWCGVVWCVWCGVCGVVCVVWCVYVYRVCACAYEHGCEQVRVCAYASVCFVCVCVRAS